jgi:beta-glucosidase
LDAEDIKYTVGAYTHNELPLLGNRLKTPDGKDGVIFSAYLEPPSIKDRERVDYKVVKKTDMFLFDYMCPQDETGLWYADIEGFLTPEMDGDFEFGLCVYGTAKLFVDGVVVIDNATKQRQGTVFFGCGTLEEIGVVNIKKDQKYHIKVEFGSAPTNTLGAGGVVRFGGGGVRIGGAFKIDPMEEIDRAVALAKDADQVVIFGGLNVSLVPCLIFALESFVTLISLQADWEGEGNDRQDMSLPGHLDTMISKVSKCNSNTVVVLQAGSPVEMPWIQGVSSVIHAWYGGNECGNAIADVLFGDVNPSGKLPLTFPNRLKDNPTYLNYRSERGRTLYGEDIYIGYRYYEAVEKDVLFSFGHGLSYTTFEFSGLNIAKDEEARILKVSCSIKNTGKVAGAEVAQVYISQCNPSIRRPVKELKGFTKVFLQPSEKKEFTVSIEMKYATSFWDEDKGMWIVEKDTYDVLVGNTSALLENTLKGSFEVEKTWWWKGL